MSKYFVFNALLFFVLVNSSMAAELPVGLISSPPHRVTRTCCAFGSDLKMLILPVLKYTDITSVGELGPHSYRGSQHEKNGIIYTQRGGFVDMGHVRDMADWTAYLYSQVILLKGKGQSAIHLGREGGLKILRLDIPSDIQDEDALKLAGRIAYDLSVWHEIATWYGSSSVPLMPERYSSFSIEDPYSNLLGVSLGIKAIQNSLPYETAMDNLISTTLEMLGAVSTEEDTYKAMEEVQNIWWTRSKRLPNRNILIKRQLNVYNCLEPWLVPGWTDKPVVSYDLKVPEMASNGILLSSFYELDLTLNYKFPVKDIFSSKIGRKVTQADFGLLINHISKDLMMGE